MIAGMILLIGLSACDNMDDTYRHFWEDGERVYPAPVDSVQVFPGRNRLGLSWIIKGDPNVTKARLYWNYDNDSVDVPIQTTGKGDTTNIVLNDMAEGSYSFAIYTYDSNSNRSVPINVVGKVYGDSYANSLLIRLINTATYADSLIVAWGSPADAGSIGSELQYRSTSGEVKKLMAAPDADTTVVKDFDYTGTGGLFSYRTVFLPDSMAIDTFYTAATTVKARGPIIELPRTGWTATASSFDNRSGANYRPPQNTLDGVTTTLWVNQIASTIAYPHWLSIDMGAIIENVEGVSMTFATVRNETPKTVEVSVSVDGEEWTQVMVLDVLNKAGTQYFDFPAPMNIRHFKLNATAASGNTPNIAVAEVGAYTR